MENNERDRKLEQWLDEALSQYSAAEPRLGLEQRVLAHVRAEEQARAGRRNWWRWMPAFAAIAAVLIVAVAIRPYWEQNAAPKEVAKTPQSNTEEHKNVAAAAKADADVASKDKGTSPASSIVADESHTDVARSQAKFENAPTSKKEAITRQDQGLSRMAAAPPGQTTVQTLDAKSSDSYITSKDNPTIELSQRSNIYTAPAAPSVAAAGVAPKPAEAMGGKVAAARTRVAETNETVQVQGAAQPVEARDSVIATEKITAIPDVSGKLKAMKVHANPKGPLAKKLEENAEAVAIPGMTSVRMNLKAVPPGPVNKFPTPVPLSKEEELMLAAAKQLKAAPAKEEKQQKNDGENNAIDIKKIEIAPLPGPPK